MKQGSVIGAAIGAVAAFIILCLGCLLALRYHRHQRFTRRSRERDLETGVELEPSNTRPTFPLEDPASEEWIERTTKSGPFPVSQAKEYVGPSLRQGKYVYGGSLLSNVHEPSQEALARAGFETAGTASGAEAASSGMATGVDPQSADIARPPHVAEQAGRVTHAVAAPGFPQPTHRRKKPHREHRGVVGRGRREEATCESSSSRAGRAVGDGGNAQSGQAGTASERVPRVPQPEATPIIPRTYQRPPPSPRPLTPIPPQSFIAQAHSQTSYRDLRTHRNPCCTAGSEPSHTRPYPRAERVRRRAPPAERRGRSVSELRLPEIRRQPTFRIVDWEAN